MLWGGLFMLLSMMGLMTFLNDDLKHFWAVMGGIGFGTFVDEIGKFITRDNNYFYEPTFAIIYVIFICLYLLYKSIQRQQLFTKEEYLINTLEKLKDVIIKDLDREEKEIAVQYLARSNPRHPVTKFLKQVFAEIDELPQERDGYYTRLRQKASSWYHFFIDQDWFLNAVDGFFLLRSLWYLISGIFLLVTVSQQVVSGNIDGLLTPRGTLPLIQFFALLMQALFTLIGATIIWKSRKEAYILFKDSVFISVFILQVFHFTRNPLLALVSVFGDFLLLNILYYMT